MLPAGIGEGDANPDEPTTKAVHFTLDRASLNIWWTSGEVLWGLPLPGTRQFGLLLKSLEPHGVTAREIIVESPSKLLADVVLGLGLLSGEVRLLLSYTGFEISIDELLHHHLKSIVTIAGSAQASLTDFREPDNAGSLTIRYAAHLHVGANALEVILRNNLPVTDAALLPDAFAYTVSPPGRHDIQEVRAVIERSLRSPENVYVEVTSKYYEFGFTEAFGAIMKEDILATLQRCGLSNVAEA